MKTIFYSGKAVTVSYLNSAQYLGPSNPGVVFVPNPINDWEYPLLKSTSLDLPNLGAYFVTTTANQSIDGTKAFTSIPEFPASTLTAGLQGVNVTRLVTDLTALNTALSSQIAANNVALNAGISAIAADLNTNYVSLATTQAITGAKTFTAIKIPATPIGPLEPISLGYFDSNTVKLTGNQTITGTKTFVDIQVPNPNAAGDAVNLGTMQTANAAINNSIEAMVTSIPAGVTLDNSYKIQAGTVTTTGNIGAGGTISGFVDFPTAFSSPPVVTATVAGIGLSSLNTDINNPTTATRWSWKLDGPSNGGVAGVINWIAVGV